MLAHSAAAHPGDTQLPSWSGSLYLAERERERIWFMDAKQEDSTEDVEGVRS